VWCHCGTDRVAVFGGNPKKRSEVVAKRLKPYRKLNQYGSDKIKMSDAAPLVRKINREEVDVVYFWRRYASHHTRDYIKKACAEMRIL
jgi:hypothetical protein